MTSLTTSLVEVYSHSSVVESSWCGESRTEDKVSKRQLRDYTVSEYPLDFWSSILTNLVVNWLWIDHLFVRGEGRESVCYLYQRNSKESRRIYLTWSRQVVSLVKLLCRNITEREDGLSDKVKGWDTRPNEGFYRIVLRSGTTSGR